MTKLLELQYDLILLDGLSYAHEFDVSSTANRNLVVNYSGWYHYGEMVSTGFVKSTINELISKRMVKKTTNALD